MRSWEYFIENDLAYDQLSSLGAQGWELVAVIRYEVQNDRKGYTEAYRTYYLKREIQNVDGQ